CGRNGLRDPCPGRKFAQAGRPPLQKPTHRAPWADRPRRQPPLKRTRPMTANRYTLRPHLEVLDERLVPSTVAAHSGAGGLWRFSDARGWEVLTYADPVAISVGVTGDVAADFGGGGLWLFTNAGGWDFLTYSTPQTFSAGVGEVVCDFGTGGLWAYAQGYG